MDTDPRKIKAGHRSMEDQSGCSCTEGQSSRVKIDIEPLMTIECQARTEPLMVKGGHTKDRDGLNWL